MTTCYWCGVKDTLADIGKELDDGKYKMVQCQKCKNAYYVVNKEKVNKPKPLTNEEWLKQCTTEQLAEWINNIVDDGIIKAWMIKNNCCGDYLESVKWWLKQPYIPLKNDEK